MTTSAAYFFPLKNAYKIQILVIKGKLQWLFAGTQSPPLELHQESLPWRQGAGRGRRSNDVSRGCVTEMQKKTDNEVVKMMQLQNQVVNHSNETQFTWEVKFMSLIFF